MFEQLNDAQKRAIQTLEGPVLVLAGPGSGKTKVLTYRVAELIRRGVSPENILAVTFTNKAANEMKERIIKLVGASAKKAWVGTFHSICLRILRAHCREMGYQPNFTIFDDHDQLHLVKQVAIKLGYEELPPKDIDYIADTISKFKIKLMTTTDVLTTASNERERMIANIFMEYQQQLMANNAVDFDDIIVQTVRLLQRNPKICKYYQDKFQYVLVDEYQDVNHAQYVLTRLLSAPQDNLFVVGDDGQSIYSFRLADITNILNFEHDFPKATVIMLEQNYRSTANIVAAANQLINNNKGQKQKALWTENPPGDLITLYQATNDIDEARFVAATIRTYVMEGMDYNSFAVLYRTSFQSRVIEDILLRLRIPYVVINGVSFYERREIKDIMAYLRIVSNTNDSLALARIINVPKRGVGETTLNRLIDTAKNNNKSVFDTINDVLSGQIKDFKISANAFASLQHFVELINKARNSNWDNLFDLVEFIVETSGYLPMLRRELNEARVFEREQIQDRIDNIGEFMSIVRDFDAEFPEGTLTDFLQEMSTLTDADRNKENNGPCVKLMTIHAAKGLEFPIVFIVGMEEELMPHSLSVMDGTIEEERRLCYVAITRAIKKLYLSWVERRNIYGQLKIRNPSRFINELPSELIEIERGDYSCL